MGFLDLMLRRLRGEYGFRARGAQQAEGDIAGRLGQNFSFLGSETPRIGPLPVWEPQFPGRPPGGQQFLQQSLQQSLGGEPAWLRMVRGVGTPRIASNRALRTGLGALGGPPAPVSARGPFTERGAPLGSLVRGAPKSSTPMPVGVAQPVGLVPPVARPDTQAPQAPQAQQTQQAQHAQQAQQESPTGQPVQRVFPIPTYRGQVRPHWGAEQSRGGTDIFVPYGSPVVSMVSGVVTFAGQLPLGGNAVQITGDDGLQYYYAHFRDLPEVQVNERVSVGQLIGHVGTSGNAAGTPPHLHLGVGKGIIEGGGGLGGTGRDYDAISALNAILQAYQR